MLNGLKIPLKQLNHTKLSNISSRAKAAKQELETLQVLILNSGVMPVTYKEEKRKAELILEAERLFIAQKAKLRYMQQGDRCTKFFHDFIKRTNKRNSIVALQKPDGITTNVPNDIANCFVVFYKGLLGQKMDRYTVNRDVILSGPCVLTSDWNALTARVSIDEIRAALFDIDNDKALGSDGFGSFFFKHAWDLIKHEVIEAVNEFFVEG
ncbi:uncharacterized protein LOC142537123 [Primulina tabacum]|uniref:uncharacterized protein LOC142537123 n=1 Tax=Primulina tabacum TaxID=48773 RepID=UPI003F59A625